MSAPFRVVPPGDASSIAAFGSTIQFFLGASATNGTMCIGLATTPPGVAPPRLAYACARGLEALKR